jgi:hypothetical protein
MMEECDPTIGSIAGGKAMAAATHTTAMPYSSHLFR